MLKGRNILLGVTGSIAAYKAAVLIRLLVREGASVRVVMTPLAKEFITPLTLATLSKNPIMVDFFDPEDGRWNSHVSLGEWADACLVAPATANTLAKMAGGVADNLLLTTYLSAKCPVFVAPAMDLDMYAHPATQENLNKLRALGVGIVEPGEGELASGLTGKGRMAEPEEIAAYLVAYFQKKKSLHGKRVMVTAGPTVEPIDPVRYISNYSTGKMGYAIAGELASRGAQVTLVSGPTALDAPAGVGRVCVTTAAEMYAAAEKAFGACDGAVFCAAVADYAPAEPAREKIKKAEGGMAVALTRTTDIAMELGRRKDGRVVAGFALETGNGLDHAQDKMARKHMDFIVLNSLRDTGAGFGHDTNKITILESDGTQVEYPLESKRQAAVRVADVMERYLLE